MAEWPLKHDGPCACRFVRREIFGAVEQTEWCAMHATQRDEIAQLRADTEAKQARIDALMFEHCPDEMTEEQKAEWARHQRPDGDE